MFRSGEMRWFFRGEMPPAASNWFGEDRAGKREPARVDDYLLLPGCRTTSVKFREGRFEVKAQTGGPKEASYEHGIAGYQDTWIKWSSEVGDPELMRDVFVREEDRWVKIEKRRHLRLISLVAPEPAEVTPGGEWLARGCQVELTAIRIWPSHEDESLATPWWSLSFEAFNDPATLLEDLDRGIEFFFHDPPEFPLERESSMSYPAWLNAASAN